MSRVAAFRIWLANKIAPRHYTVLPSYVMHWIEAGLTEPEDVT